MLLGVLYLYRNFRFFFFRNRFSMRIRISWNIPNGQMAEQNIRPKSRLNNNKNTIISTFPYNKAGTHWICRIECSWSGSISKKSKKKSPITRKNTSAIETLIFLILFILKFYSLYIQFIQVRDTNTQTLSFGNVPYFVEIHFLNLVEKFNCGRINRYKIRRNQ